MLSNMNGVHVPSVDESTIEYENFVETIVENNRQLFTETFKGGRLKNYVHEWKENHI